VNSASMLENAVGLGLGAGLVGLGLGGLGRVGRGLRVGLVGTGLVGVGLAGVGLVVLGAELPGLGLGLGLGTVVLGLGLGMGLGDCAGGPRGGEGAGLSPLTTTPGLWEGGPFGGDWSKMVFGDAAPSAAEVVLLPAISQISYNA
jgi:hypothetical protein